MTLPIRLGSPAVTIHRNDRIVISAEDGSIDPAAAEGFFVRDTRLLSAYRLTVDGRTPTLRESSPVDATGARFAYAIERLTDPGGKVATQTLSLRLERTVGDGVHEDYELVNHGSRPVTLHLAIELASDFADSFDVRAGRVVRRGDARERWSPSRQELRADYRNGTFARSLIVAAERSGSPARFADGRLSFDVEVAASGSWRSCLRWLPVIGRGRRARTLPCHAIGTARGRGARARGRPVPTRLETPNAAVARAWDQAQRDLDSLRLEDPITAPGHVIPAAGVPWYVTLFGRDSLIASMQTVATSPEFVAGTLARLSALQATADDPERDMEPGKIIHEIRFGELAELGILPFQPYYGTHDATSLFVIALSEAFRWSGDRDVLRRHVSNAEAAMAWIDRSGDRDGDGFQEYATRSSHGHPNQGWKDAHDAIRMRDGTHAALPIALCEFQGYAYDAKLRLAEAYDVLGRPGEAARLRASARTLFERFNETFWWEAEGTYYLGLDGAKRPIESVASNAGHCLASGIVPPDRAARVAERLMAPDMWSGWGIRTLSATHVAYDPLSYHNGSVWPHDNAIAADGFARYGHRAQAARVARGLFDAAERFEANRLPEVFAGLPRDPRDATDPRDPRDPGGSPVPYPGANVPQAWAAGSIIALIGTLCGLRAERGPAGPTIRVDPALPDWLPELTLHDLHAGSGTLSLRIRGDGVEVLANSSGLDVQVGRTPAGTGAASLDVADREYA